jgi:hypothetical protein
MFITRNGKDIEQYHLIKTTSLLKVIVNISMSTGININFGNRKFEFDLKKINNVNKVLHSTKSNLVNKGFNLKKFQTEYYINNKPFIKEYIYNLIPSQQG